MLQHSNGNVWKIQHKFTFVNKFFIAFKSYSKFESQNYLSFNVVKFLKEIKKYL